MRPDADVTAFSAMFTEMAYQWSHSRRKRKPELELVRTEAAADPDAGEMRQDEARIRAAMEAALERRRQQRTRVIRRDRRQKDAA